MNKIHNRVPRETRAGRLVEPLLRYLPNLFGRRNVKTAEQLTQALGFPARRTCHPLREAAKILLIDREVPMVSCTRGFFLAETKEEIATYKESLLHRVDGLMRDVEACNRILLKDDILENVELDTAQQLLW